MGKYQLGDWLVDSSRNVIHNDSVTIKIEPKCMDLLMLLIGANGDLVSRETIMESLWQGRYVSEHALNNVVAMLRKYLKNGVDKNYITTLPKRGYLLNIPEIELQISPVDVSKVEQNRISNKFMHYPATSIWVAVLALVTTIATIYFVMSTSKAEHSIVVFPFEVIDSDDNTILFAKGLSEQISDGLSSKTSLSVVAPLKVQSTENDELSNLSIAQHLNASYFLEGVVSAEQDLLRITSRLVNKDTGIQLWSKVYTVNKQEISANQYSLSRQLTNTISASLETGNVLPDSASSPSPLHQSPDSSSRTPDLKLELTPNASDFFLHLSERAEPSQSMTNEWQIGMYQGGELALFDYSPTTLLGRTAIVGWVNRGFHAGFLNTSDKDEIFPGNVFKAKALVLHPGDNSAEIVLRYLVQQNGTYEISGHFLAMDSIECLKCTSDGVNVSVRVNGNQLNTSGDITGFGDTNTFQIAASGTTLHQGDIVDFILMPRSTFFDDATIVTANVTLIN